MCVKIIYAKNEIEYDPEKALDLQLKNSKEVIVDYKSDNDTIEKFLEELEKFCDKGNSKILNIKVIHNNYISGAMAKKRAYKIKNELIVNNLIKILALSHSEIDKKLEEISDICSGKMCIGNNNE